MCISGQARLLVTHQFFVGASIQSLCWIDSFTAWFVDANIWQCLVVFAILNHLSCLCYPPEAQDKIHQFLSHQLNVSSWEMVHTLNFNLYKWSLQFACKKLRVFVDLLRRRISHKKCIWFFVYIMQSREERAPTKLTRTVNGSTVHFRRFSKKGSPLFACLLIFWEI